MVLIPTSLFATRYERLLRRARTEDLSEVSGIGCLYQSGVDRLGRPVVVFIGKWFPISDIDLEKVSLTGRFRTIVDKQNLDLEP